MTPRKYHLWRKSYRVNSLVDSGGDLELLCKQAVDLASRGVLVEVRPATRTNDFVLKVDVSGSGRTRLEWGDGRRSGRIEDYAKAKDQR